MWASARLFLLALVVSGCASVAPIDAAGRRPASPDLVRFGVDTFAFPNESRSKNPGKPDLYANYCFVMARGVTQFQRFARFDAAAPRLTPQEYVARVKDVVAQAPWEDPWPADRRIVIPGYASLHEFSRAQEAAVKEGLGGRFWTLVHWTNWRVTFPVTRGHQATVAREVMDELDAGHLVQLLVTNWPKPELNHTVVAFGYRPGPQGMEFVVWDPNDPAEPGVMTFDSEAGRFRASHIYDTEPGLIRAFRMYYSWLL